MASLSIAAFLRNNNNALITGPTPRVLLAVTTKHFHVSTRMERSVSDKATDAQEKVSKKAQEGANTISDAAGNLKEKAKNAAEETWDKVTDTVTGKSEETKDSIKALRRPSTEA